MSARVMYGLVFIIATIVAAITAPQKGEQVYEFKGLGTHQVNWEGRGSKVKNLNFQKGGFTTDFWVDVVLENTASKRGSYTLHAAGFGETGNLICAANARWIGLLPGEAKSECVNFYTENFETYKGQLHHFKFRVETK